MEEKLKSLSPPSFPYTVTVRRNPPRKAKATPYTTGAKLPAASLASRKSHDVPSFPIDEILQMPPSEPKPSEVPASAIDEVKSTPMPPSEAKASVSESLKIFLRIKPLKILTKATTTKIRPKIHAWPQNPSKKNTARNQENAKKNKKNEEACITLNDPYSVTLTPPQALQELKRSKTEVYEGFSHVFPADCSQNDVYDEMVQPLLEDFMKGKSGMLAALGPSGSGKTHTVFGTPKDPGIVPLALRQIFKKSDECSSLRSFHLSIFEIYSERGKGEKASDLLGGESSELYVQQSTIRGLKEVPIHNLEEAGSLIGQAMLKRATATTNSNSQSSRSQCIINIRATYDGISDETQMQPSDAMLTIVDLAGAEREKRTGNQGERLVESNFINNTSMVFSQCLRSLLEYQKNRKKGLQKHYQNSLLTKYLRDYLEGKKRMALIITVKAGEEDYQDTSYLLRQASPYMKIKFDNIEEPCNKRQLKTFPRVEKNKKIKLSAPKISQVEEIVAEERNQISQEVDLKEKKADPTDRSSPRLEHVARDKAEREHIIMRNFAKVLWNLLKQNNEKLKVAESDICSLMENLRSEQLKSRGLETDLINVKEKLRSEQFKSRGLETELINLKSSCLLSKSNLITEVEAPVQAKEEFEVDTSLAHAVGNVDDDPPKLTEERIEVGVLGEEECNESPVSSKNVIAGLGNEEISCTKQGDPTPVPKPTETRIEVGAEECNESPVPGKNVIDELGNEEISCTKQGDPTPTEQVEVGKECINLKSSSLLSKSNLAEPYIPEVESPFQAKEQFKVDTSLAHTVGNVDDDDDPKLIETRKEVRADECNESPVASKNVVAGLGNEEIFCTKQGDTIPVPTLIETRIQVGEEECNESPVTSKNVIADIGNEEISCAKRGDPRPPEQVEVSQACINNRLSDIQTRSAISRIFSDSEKQKRNRRLLATSSTLLTEEMNDLHIKENQTEKPQVKMGETRVQEKAESTQGREIEVPTRKSESTSTKKPRRRLQPASSVLLTREINTLEIEDDITEPKGTRGGRKKTTGTVAQPRSQGSVTLLRLLTNNLHL